MKMTYSPRKVFGVVLVQKRPLESHRNYYAPFQMPSTFEQDKMF